MTPPAEGEDVTVRELPEMDDSTPDQDDPNAPEGDVHPELNADANLEDDEDNTDSIIADNAEQDEHQEHELDGAEPTFFPQHKEGEAHTEYVPIEVSEGNTPIVDEVVEEEEIPEMEQATNLEPPTGPATKVVPADEGAPVIVEENEYPEPIEEPEEEEEEPSEELQQAEDAIAGKEP